MAIILEDSPSLERYLAEIFERTYQVARREAENPGAVLLVERLERIDITRPAPRDQRRFGRRVAAHRR